MRSIVKYAFWITILIATVLFVTEASAVRVLLVKPSATAQSFEQKDPERNYLSQYFAARNLLGLDSNYVVTETIDVALPQDLSKFDLIILPGVLALDNALWLRLKGYLHTGGGVFASSEFGAFNGSGEWIGYANLRDVFGVDPTEWIDSTNATNAIQFSGNVTALKEVSPAQTILVHSSHQKLTIPKSDNLLPLGYWLNDRNSSSYLTGVHRIAVAARVYPTGGRFVWCAADLADLGYARNGKNNVATSMNAIWKWIAGEPSLSIDPWQSRKQAVVILNCDVESNLNQLKQLNRVLSRYPGKITYNVCTSALLSDPDILKVLAKNSDFSLIANHPGLLWGQPAEVQTQRVGLGLDFMMQFVKRPTGLHPPRSAFDNNTLIAMRKNQIEYYFSESREPFRYPEWIPDETRENRWKGFVVFSNSDLDDSLWIAYGNTYNLDSLSTLFERELNYNLDIGGLYQFRIHSDNLNNRILTAGFEKFLDRLKFTENYWITTERQVAQWIRARAKVKVELIAEKKRHYIKITNTGSDNVDGMTLTFIPPKSVSANLLIPFGSYLRNHSTISGNVVSIRLPQLQANASVKFALGY